MTLSPVIRESDELLDSENERSSSESMKGKETVEPKPDIKDTPQEPPAEVKEKPLTPPVSIIHI